MRLFMTSMEQHEGEKIVKESQHRNRGLFNIQEVTSLLIREILAPVRTYENFGHINPY